MICEENVIFTGKSIYKRETVSNNYLHRGARGVMVIVVGNGHGDTSSNPGRG